MPDQQFFEAKAHNSSRSCGLSSCGRPRDGLNRWCTQHTRTAARYGHPLARPFRSSEWSSHRKEVERLFQANTDHPGLLQVQQLVADWMASAANGGTSKGDRELVRLASAGVAPRAVITEACAAWAWLEDRPHSLPDDRSRDFFLARAVFALAPRPRRPCGAVHASWSATAKGLHSYAPRPLQSALATVGQRLRLTLAAFLVNVARALKEERLRKADPERDLRAPFRAPAAAPTAAASGLPFPG